MGRSAVLRWLLQLAVSLGMVAGVIWWSGPTDLLRIMRSADPRWLAAAVAVFATVTTLHGVRWWVLLRPVGRVPLHQTILVLLVAKAVGILIPFRAGAVLQVQLLGRRYELDRAAVAGTLVLEAVVDAACFLILFIAIAPFIGAGRYLTAGVWIMAAIVIAALAGLFFLSRRQTDAELRTPRGGVRGRLAGLVRSVREGFAAVRSPAAVAAAVLLTFADWSMATLGFGLIGRAFGLDTGPATYVLVEVISNLAGAVPFTQSGIGPYEIAVPQMLSRRGVPLDLGTAYAVGAHALIIPTWLTAGAIALAVLRIRPGEVLYLKNEAGAKVGPHPPSPSPNAGRGGASA